MDEKVGITQLCIRYREGHCRSFGCVRFKSKDIKSLITKKDSERRQSISLYLSN